MEESKLSSQVPEEKSATEDVPVKAMNEETSKEEEKEEEDTTSDEGYVKVEREGIDTKDDDEKTEFENSRKMIKEKESVYALLKNQEENIRTANEKLTKVLKENELLEAEITTNDAKMKEICNGLEEKLKCSDEKISKTDALLSQAWSNNSELKHKLKSLEQVYKEFGSPVTENGTQKSLSLEDVVKSSLQEAEEAKSQLKDLKTEFIATGNVNVELEKRLKLLQLKNSDADVELKRLSDEISELKSALEVAKNEEKQSLNQKQEYQKKVTKLESSLSMYEQTKADCKRYLDQVADLNSTLEDFQVKNSSKEAALNKAIKKLKIAEEKLEQQAREIDEAATRNKELENQINYKVKNLVATVEKLRSKCNFLKKDRQALAKVNQKLKQELANHNTKKDEFKSVIVKLEKELTAEKSKGNSVVRNAAALSAKANSVVRNMMFKLKPNLQETKVEEVKSRDIGLSNSAPTQTVETKHHMTVKIVLGLGVIAIVAIIIGIIIVWKKF